MCRSPSWGPVEVGLDGRRVEVAGTRVRRLLTRLAVDADRAVSVNELSIAVWPDDPPTNVANALQTLVSRLRRALGDHGLICQEFGGYRLAAPSDAVDVQQFGDAVKRGRAALRDGRPQEAAVLLDGALGLWRGDPLHDAGDAEYVSPLVERWEQQRLDAIADRIEADLALGRSRERVVDLETLASAHPLRERFTSLLISALAAEARTADALTAYERLRIRLADELGVDPSPRLQEQHLELLRGLASGPATAQPPSGIPSPLTGVIGRTTEVKRIFSLLASSRLVSIVGTGGAGKTRLAVEIGETSRDQHRDGVWLVQLAPVSEESGVVRALSEPLGRYDGHVLDITTERPSLDPVERLVERLRPMDTLLIVDNCEHVIGWTAALLDRLLTSCPRLRVLTTSREPLGIAGEALCVLSPLAVPEPGCSVERASEEPSVQLFRERAEAVDGDFALDEVTVSDVVEIVRRLDGLPLAIELAAARLRVMPVAEVARRLSDRFRLLTGGSRTAVPRHRTLRAVVDWSWSLLEPEERLLAERLSVFPSGATPESAEAICADERLPAARIPELLDSLVDRSLLKSADEAGLRYRMLETIREYGIERLADRDEVVGARTAHARHFARLAAELDPALRGDRQLTALRTFNLERDNLLSALRFLGDSGDSAATLAMTWSLCWYWVVAGTHGEAAWWLRFALAVPGETDEPTRLLLETVLILSQMAESDPQHDTVDGRGSRSRTVPYGEEAFRARARELDLALDRFEFTEPAVLAMRPMVAFCAGDSARARELGERALATDDPWTRAAVLTFAALLADNEGDIEAMRQYLDRSVEPLRGVGDRWLLGSNLAARGRIATLDGDLTGAITALEQARANLLALGSADDQAFLGFRLAELYLRVGDVASARREMTAVTREGDLPWGPGDIIEKSMLMWIARLEGDVEEAENKAAQVRAGICELVSPSPLHGHARAMLLGGLAAHEVWRSRLDAAASLLEEAYQVAVATRDMPIVSSVGLSVAAFVEATGDEAAAAELLGAAAALRGADDETDLMVRALTMSLRDSLREGFEAAYGTGRALARDDALARLDPAAYTMGVTAAG